MRSLRLAAIVFEVYVYPRQRVFTIQHCSQGCVLEMAPSEGAVRSKDRSG